MVKSLVNHVDVILSMIEGMKMYVLTPFEGNLSFKSLKERFEFHPKSVSDACSSPSLSCCSSLLLVDTLAKEIILGEILRMLLN